METCINYCEPDFAYISSDERRWIKRITLLAEERPEECFILKQPEDNGGFIYAKFPYKWARVSPPRQYVMPDEKRAEYSNRMREMNEKRLSETQ